MTQHLTQEDLADILHAFEHSRFARLTLNLGATRLSVNRAVLAEAARPDSLPVLVPVVAPLLGIYQAGAEPGAPAFVGRGDRVDHDTTIGIIRVMQAQTPVKAGLAGTVAAVLVRDGQLVEYGQALLELSTEPEATAAALSRFCGRKQR